MLYKHDLVIGPIKSFQWYVTRSLSVCQSATPASLTPMFHGLSFNSTSIAGVLRPTGSREGKPPSFPPKPEIRQQQHNSSNIDINNLRQPSISTAQQTKMAKIIRYLLCLLALHSILLGASSAFVTASTDEEGTKEGGRAAVRNFNQIMDEVCSVRKGIESNSKELQSALEDVCNNLQMLKILAYVGSPQFALVMNSLIASIGAYTARSSAMKFRTSTKSNSSAARWCYGLSCICSCGAIVSGTSAAYTACTKQVGGISRIAILFIAFGVPMLANGNQAQVIE